MSTLPESRRFALALEGSVKNARSYRSTPRSLRMRLILGKRKFPKFQDFLEKESASQVGSLVDDR